MCILWKLLWLKTKVFLLQSFISLSKSFFIDCYEPLMNLHIALDCGIFKNLKNSRKTKYCEKISKNFRKFQKISIKLPFLRKIYIFWKISKLYILSSGRALDIEREVTGVNQYKRVCVLRNQPWIKYFIFWYFIIFSLSNCIYFNFLIIRIYNL